MKHADTNDVQYGFVFEQARCSGCKTCQVACADYHDLPKGVFLRSVYAYAGGGWTQDRDGCWTHDVYGYFVSLSCNHCNDPVCMRFCTSGALSRQADGIIQLNPTCCTCCQTCMLACPYHAPRFNYEEGVMVKCDGCLDRVVTGKSPVCVDACPTRALQFGNFDELRGRANASYAVAPMPPSSLSLPNYAIVPCAAARPVDDNHGSIMNMHEA